MFKIKDNVRAVLEHFLLEDQVEEKDLALQISHACGVNLNIWQIKSHRIVGNMWTVNGKFGKGDNQHWSEAKNKQLKIVIDYERIAPDNRNDFRDEFIQMLLSKSPKRTRRTYFAKEGSLSLLDTPDLHLGRLSYGKETGDNYDIKIAVKRDNDSTDYLVSEAEYLSNRSPIKEVLVVYGNDYFNYDYAKPFPQTSNGTPQESDVRFQKMFMTGCDQSFKRIERISELAPVRVIIIPGNHDEQISFYMGVVLNAYFKNNENVTVDTSPGSRKFYQFGKNMLGFDHGQYPTFERLFANMAFGDSKMWADTKFKYFFTAHMHHKETKVKLYQGIKELKLPKGQILITEDLNGILFDRLGSLTSNDYYEHSMGMIHIKGAEMFMFHPEFGKTHTLNYQLPLSIHSK